MKLHKNEKFLDFVLLTYKKIDVFKRYLLSIAFGYASSCKHTPTCSEYTVLSIKKDGIIKGLIKGFIRIINCR